MDNNPSRVIALLRESEVYRSYEDAFTKTTGLPLELVESVAQPGDLVQSSQNPFCSLLANVNPACQACQDTRHRLAVKAEHATEPVQVTCFAELVETAVPIISGGESIGFLRTGGISTEAMQPQQFSRTARSLLSFGVQVDLRRAEEAFFQSRVLLPEQYDAMVRLLHVFSQHLATMAEHISIQERPTEPEVISKAREFMETNATEPLSLADVANAVNVSSYYFCRIFKKATGLSFTQYLSRLRVERAKNLLLNPNRRITEVAYDAGFESITHFNRVFRQLVGQSPSQFRQAMASHEMAA